MYVRRSPTFPHPPAIRSPCRNRWGTQKNCPMIHARVIPISSYNTATSARGPVKWGWLNIHQGLSFFFLEFSPNTLTLSFVNAGTILENKRAGPVILKTIWAAPLAATGGKISAFVIMNPLATPAAL